MAEKAAASGSNSRFDVMKFMYPSFDIVTTFPQGIVELVLRGAAVILALVSLIPAATCQVYLRDLFTLTKAAHSVYGNLVPNTSLTAGWIIFLSFWVTVYQVAAIIQLFIRVRIVYTIIPVINWSLFFLIDIIAIGIAAGGYFCGAVPMAVYAERWSILNLNSVSSTLRNIHYKIISSAGATASFSIFSMLLFVGVIVYFLIARYVLKWSTHGEKISGEKSSSTQDNDQVDE